MKNISTSKIRIRESVDALSPELITRFQVVFEKIYNDPLKRYFAFPDVLIRYGHATWNDLDFLTWNRAFFLQMELLILEYDPGLFLPYWDYTGPKALSNGLPEIFEAETFVDPVTGETRPNPLRRGNNDLKLLTYRENNNEDTSGLKSAAQRELEAMKQDSYAFFSNRIWRTDATGHAWIGGTMTELSSAPYDPLFWFFHCNLDRFWFNWQHKHGNDSVPSTVLETPLSPFKDKNGQPYFGAAVLNTEDLGYTYNS